MKKRRTRIRLVALFTGRALPLEPPYSKLDGLLMSTMAIVVEEEDSPCCDRLYGCEDIGCPQ